MRYIDNKIVVFDPPFIVISIINAIINRIVYVPVTMLFVSEINDANPFICIPISLIIWIKWFIFYLLSMGDD